MKIEEIRNYVANSRVCVDISTTIYSGFVRKIVFYARNRVCIEFVGHMVDESESGYEYCSSFSSLEEAVACIERYLSSPAEDWINYTKTGQIPQIEYPIDIGEGHEHLRKDILEKSVLLPSDGHFEPKFDLNSI